MFLFAIECIGRQSYYLLAKDSKRRTPEKYIRIRMYTALEFK